MKFTKISIWVLILFVVVLTTRLFLAFQTPHFTIDSYFDLRQIDEIKQKGLPLFNDPLSYGGRLFVFPPFFHYILAFFSILLTPALAAKIIPSIFYASIVIIVFLISKKITKDNTAAFFSAVLSGFIPVIMAESLKISPQSLFLPLFFLIILLFTDLDQNKVNTILILMVLLVLTSPITLLFVLVLVLYLLILKIEGLSPSKKEVELSLFFIFLTFWSLMLIYKKALFFHGLNIFMLNIPKALKAKTFIEINFGQSFIYLGILVIAFGIYGSFLAFKEKKSKESILAISVIGIFFLALIFQVIPLALGLAFLGVALSIMGSVAIKGIYSMFSGLKFVFSKHLFFLLFFILFTGFSIIPGIMLSSDISNTVNNEEFHALKWINENTEQGSVILGSPREGHIIAYIAERKNFFDTNYLNIHSVEQRFDDYDTMYTSVFQTDAIPLLRYYNIDYIYFSPRVSEYFNITKIPYAEEKCLKLVYDKSPIIYKFVCKNEAN